MINIRIQTTVALLLILSLAISHAKEIGHSSNDITLHSYNSHVDEYQNGTTNQVSGCFKDWMDITMSLLTQDATILEIGSAFGRDARYFESFGFRVNRTDAAQGFVDLLNNNGYSAHIFNVLTDEFESTYDLIFANAVFLHFNQNEFKHILTKIHKCLNPQGILSFSLKYGDGHEWTTEKLALPRYYCYWKKETLLPILKDHQYDILYLRGDEKWLQVIVRPIK